MRRWTVPLGALAALDACSEPPPESLLIARGQANALDLGRNAADELYSLLRGASEGQIYCGRISNPRAMSAARRRRRTRARR